MEGVNTTDASSQPKVQQQTNNKKGRPRPKSKSEEGRKVSHKRQKARRYQRARFILKSLEERRGIQIEVIELFQTRKYGEEWMDMIKREVLQHRELGINECSFRE